MAQAGRHGWGGTSQEALPILPVLLFSVHVLSFEVWGVSLFQPLTEAMKKPSRQRRNAVFRPCTLAGYRLGRLASHSRVNQTDRQEALGTQR